MPSPSPSSQRDAGSFRDPSGYVFQREGRIFRAIDAPCEALLRELSDAGHLKQWVAERRIVGSEFVPAGPLADALGEEHPEAACFLEHERLPTITYPYEWSVSMLADAAVQTLDLQLQLLERGCSLKDATAYNIQFSHARPVFIDLSSMERPSRLDVWFALGQFSQMFLFPLLLSRLQGWDLRSYFLGSLAGRSIEAVGGAFGPPSRSCGPACSWTSPSRSGCTAGHRRATARSVRRWRRSARTPTRRS